MNNSKKIEILDSTLRDGAQGMGISFTLKDKLAIARLLDEFGVDFIEAGNPASNIKDAEFFKAVFDEPFFAEKIVAFGSTRRRGTLIEQDVNIRKICDTGANFITIFGKSSIFHAENILRVSESENLEMIRETIEYLVKKGKTVFFDAEHFFDGYKNNPKYALSSLKIAAEAGAAKIILCDTNGGSFPFEVENGLKAAFDLLKKFSVTVGIHCHNDVDCATANTVSAILGGVKHLQGTFIGIGERCGNADLSAILPNLQLKLGFECVPEIVKITEVTRKIAEIANIKLGDHKPYVGRAAFTHKAGMHADGVLKSSRSFEHITPELVGNKRNILLSEAAGRAIIVDKIKKIAPTLTVGETGQILELIKRQEFLGYQYEAAEASFELLVLRFLGKLKKFFNIEYYHINAGKEDEKEPLNVAAVKVRVKNQTEITAAEGAGPVNAIDMALRGALKIFYPQIANIHLTDYKVRIIDTISATAAQTRVLIESSDGVRAWSTVGVSMDIIEASTDALKDSLIYYLQNFSADF